MGKGGTEMREGRRKKRREEVAETRKHPHGKKILNSMQFFSNRCIFFVFSVMMQQLLSSEEAEARKRVDSRKIPLRGNDSQMNALFVLRY